MKKWVHLLLILLALMSSPATFAATITLQGSFTTDDSVQLFSFFVSSPTVVEVRSYGYAGGATSSGASIPAGGFDSILTLFSASGAFLEDNDEGAGVVVDPNTGLVGDARIAANLMAGNYILALTQFDNFSIGDLADGFGRTGEPNFTADPGFTSGGACGGNMFRDISGTDARCRTGNWTLEFANVDSAIPEAPVPEPSAMLLMALGLGIFLVCRRGKAAILLVGLVVVSFSIQAQTTGGPNYSNVSDFLNGQRSLLRVKDLQAFRISSFTNDTNGYNIGNGLDTYQLATSYGQDPTVTDPGSRDDSPADVNKPLLTFSAHMFNQPADSTLTTMADFQHSGTFGLLLQNVPGGSAAKQASWNLLSDNPTVWAGTVADFNQDGYEELALNFDDGRLVIVYPKDLTNVAPGFNSVTTPIGVHNAMTAGDFNGDGQPEIAALYTELATGVLKLMIYAIDRKTLSATLAGSLPLTVPGASATNPVTKYAIDRGRFNTAGHDQLAVAFGTNQGFNYVEVIDFSPNSLNPIEPATALQTETIVLGTGYLQLKTGRFSLPNSSLHSIVYHSSAPTTNGRYFRVLKVDPATLVVGGINSVPLSYENYPCATGIEVGNFDNRQTSPTNPNQTQPNPNDQVALMYCRGTPPPGQQFLGRLSRVQHQRLQRQFNNVRHDQSAGQHNEPRSAFLRG